MEARSSLYSLLHDLASSSNRDLYASLFGIVGALLWVKIFDVLCKLEVIDQKLSRKLVHITTGPVFVLTWPLFSNSPWAPLYASVVPLLNLARLLLTGSGQLSDKGLVQSLSRTGSRQELLRGPLCYVLVMLAATATFWRSSLVGLVMLSMMCGGDGLADIVGRRLGRGNSLPFNRSKSIAGSLAMLLGGGLMALGLIAVFHGLGLQARGPVEALPAVAAASAAATLAEALPINQMVDDNLSVPLTAAAAAMIVLGGLH